MVLVGKNKGQSRRLTVSGSAGEKSLLVKALRDDRMQGNLFWDLIWIGGWNRLIQIALICSDRHRQIEARLDSPLWVEERPSSFGIYSIVLNGRFPAKSGRSV